ncbi:MerR family transcriptional regulator [Pseudomonas sp. RIT412]|nr:MerR family transcriptional regulator [Pseudomonas sp. RIT 409]RAU51502.1 MerR family transcriptional regulator [Pseudomonas sp. RIT 412]
MGGIDGYAARSRSEGLIRAVKRTANGYRQYGPETELMLTIIVRAQNAGFSLEEIQHLMPTSLDAWEYDALLDALKRKVGEIEALQQRLEQNKAQLLATIEGIERKPQGVGCADNARRMLDGLKARPTAPEQPEPARLSGVQQPMASEREGYARQSEASLTR